MQDIVALQPPCTVAACTLHVGWLHQCNLGSQTLFPHNICLCVLTGRHDYTVKKALTIDSIRLGVPSFSHLIAFAGFQALVHLVIIILEAFASDGNGWLPWAVTLTAVCTLLTIGILTTARQQMFGSMVVFAILWALSTVSAIIVSMVFRPECGKAHYQPLVEVGLLVFLGCVSPWFLLLQAVLEAHACKARILMCENYIRQLHKEKDQAESEQAQVSVPNVQDKDFEVVLQSQTRPRRSESSNKKRRSLTYEGNMPEEILRSEGFLAMELERVLEFLSDDELPVQSELATFDAVLSWIAAGDFSSARSWRGQANHRSKCLIPLMGCVRFGLMEQASFAHVARSSRLELELQRDPSARSHLSIMVWNGLRHAVYASDQRYFGGKDSAPALGTEGLMSTRDMSLYSSNIDSGRLHSPRRLTGNPSDLSTRELRSAITPPATPRFSEGAGGVIDGQAPYLSSSGAHRVSFADGLAANPAHPPGYRPVGVPAGVGMSNATDHGGITGVAPAPPGYRPVSLQQQPYLQPIAGSPWDQPAQSSSQQSFQPVYMSGYFNGHSSNGPSMA